MSVFSVDDLLRLSIFDGASILAGESGLGRDVKFIDFIEVPDAYRWLAKDTFIFTAGYAFRDTPDALTELIRVYLSGGVSGFGIKLGRFIDFLPDEIYEMANRAGFPIISLPEALPYAVIAKTVMREIFKREQEEPFKEGDWGEGLFLMDRDPDGAIDILEMHGWNRGRKVWALQINGSFPSVPALASRPHLLNFKDKTRIAVLAEEGETPDKFLEFLKSVTCGMFDTSLVSLYGPCLVEKLPLAFKKISDAQYVAISLGHTQGFFTYTQLELLTLVCRFVDKKSIIFCAQKLLSPLIEEDSRGHMELVRTLSVWLACERSVQRASSVLYIHRNTLRYRLNKIETFIPLNEDNLFLLRIALMFYCAPSTIHNK